MSEETLSTREASVFRTMQKIYDHTKDGTHDNFATIFGGAGGDGNVWNILRRLKTVRKTDGQYRWFGMKPTEFFAITVASDAAQYVEEKKKLKAAAGIAIDKLKMDMAAMGKDLAKDEKMTFYVQTLRLMYKDLLVIDKYMAKNLTNPNPEYDGIGSV